MSTNFTSDTPATSGFTTPHDLETGQPSGADSQPQYLQFTPRKRPMASFENLVALANYQERLSEARKMVWRDRGEPVIELRSLRACLEHAAKGGARAGTIAFSIRAALNLVLALIRIQRVPRDLRLKVIRQQVFGMDAVRFAAMLGTFVSVYKYLINALPIIIPAIRPQRRSAQLSSPFDDDEDEILEIDLQAAKAGTTVEVPIANRKARLSLSTHAQMALIRKRTRRWHAALAGAVAGGLAIMWETRGKRGEIAQQMFVRGLQGAYSSFTTRRGIKVPHGDILVFSLACGQIMYGYILRPDTLPKSYTTWITQAGKIPQECVRMNKSLVRQDPGSINLVDINNLLSRDDITASNYTTLLELKASLLSGSKSFARYAPCAAVHPPISSCMTVPLDRFFDVFKWMLPIYGALHLIPTILFKRKAFMNDPGKMLVRAGWGTTRSSAFLGMFVVIFQSAFCYKHYLHRLLSLSKLPRWLIDTLVSKWSFWILGFLSGLSLFIEEKRRRSELAMYVLPKALESAWVMARGKGLVFGTGNWGEVLLTAVGMSMVMSTYQNDPQHLSGLVRRILYQFIGPN